MAFTATPERRRLQPICVPCVDRHRAFAAQLNGARRIEARTSPVERVLRRANRPGIHQTWLRLMCAFNIAAHAARQSPSTFKPGVQKILRVDGARTVERLIDRQRSLSTRVIEYHNAQPGQAPRPELQTLIRERIERRSAFPKSTMTVVHQRAAARSPHAAVDRPDAAPETTARRLPIIEAARSADKAGVALPAQELSRITDHVIGQLDRRVLSYRERLGRV